MAGIRRQDGGVRHVIRYCLGTTDLAGLQPGDQYPERTNMRLNCSRKVRRVGEQRRKALQRYRGMACALRKYRAALRRRKIS